MPDVAFTGTVHRGDGSLTGGVPLSGLPCSQSCAPARAVGVLHQTPTWTVVRVECPLLLRPPSLTSTRLLPGSTGLPDPRRCMETASWSTCSLWSVTQHNCHVVTVPGGRTRQCTIPFSCQILLRHVNRPHFVCLFISQTVILKASIPN